MLLHCAGGRGEEPWNPYKVPAVASAVSAVLRKSLKFLLVDSPHRNVTDGSFAFYGQ